MVEGESGIINISPPWFRPVYEPSKRRLTWPNGARAIMYSAEDPEALRGPQFEAAWLDELAKWRYARDAFDMLQYGLRLGPRPVQCITTTPRPTPIVKELLQDDLTILTRGSTYDNIRNVSPIFAKKIIKRYEGTRLGRQELNAEILDDVPGALWTRAMLDEALRIGKGEREYSRVIVSIDPSGTSGDEDDLSNDIGITVVGRRMDGKADVLADVSCHLSPDGWGRRAVNAYYKYGANLIVAEKNFGGAMVEHVIKTVDRAVPVKVVTASRGKFVRAEPVAALYEQGRVGHVECFGELEDQLVLLTSMGYMGEGSPDRLDALVWGLSELMLLGSQYNLEHVR